MNQKIASADFNTATATPRQPAPLEPKPTKDGELAALLSAMIDGENALAKRKDIGELHKRLISAMTTMNSGLSEAQAMRVAEDRLQISEKLEEVERAINSMEGALRIELEPMLRNILIDASEQNQTTKRGAIRMVFPMLIFFTFGLALGAVFQNPIKSTYNSAYEFATPYIQQAFAVLPPNWGRD